MRIGFIGNTNNYPLMLALAMSKLGHEIVFIVDCPETLHRPECYANLDELSQIELHDFTGVISNYYQFFFPNKRLRELSQILSNCDCLIVNGVWPAFIAKLSKPYIVLITGSDLEVQGDPLIMFKNNWKASGTNPLKKLIPVLIVTFVAWQQHRAIGKAAAYNYFPRGAIPNGDRLLDKLPKRSQRLCFMMTDVDRRKLTPAPNNKIIRILLTARHCWRLPIRVGSTQLDYKGTDIFLHGVAKFRSKNKQPIQLILIKKGPDVPASMELIQSLSLQDCVEWRNEMTQKQLFEEYIKTDIIADQFARSFVGMAGLDAMAMGRPLLANGRPEFLEPLFGEPSPICQASTPEEVCLQLERLLDLDERKRVGKHSRSYVEKYFSSRLAALQCLKIFSES